ncbi:M48 family metallopeptidase [Thalassotalea atypica]|uniref:M48 family metallopeptidase n=1 Tax=Thalassotalea atypica TaxID=2054316 RepID=UPI0025745900|nr:SprT family zinc-dependent metalloprotease [Thalassotalea atypica]
MQHVNYDIIRSARRKTLALQVKQGEITVRAPIELCERYIEKFVQTKSAWLEAKVNEQKLAKSQHRISFESGSVVPFLGENKVLTIVGSSTSNVSIENESLIISLRVCDKQKPRGNNQQEQAQFVYEQWLKNQASIYIGSRLSAQAALMSLKYKSVVFKRYKARWGSCNNRAELSFNYLLMMCPKRVVDYVIIHELSHLIFLNHSKEFWQLVKQYCPNYKEAQYWLKSHSLYIR